MINLTRTLLIAGFAILIYTGCQKNTLKPVTTAATTDYATLSGQAAVTLYKSITGQYGGTDVSRGIASHFGVKNGGKTVFSTVPLCGFVIDTNYNYTVYISNNHVIVDTTKTYYGSFHFQYTCTGGQVNGYRVDDSLNFNESGYNSFDNVTAVGQHYTVKALDQTYKLVSMDGSINTGVSLAQTFDETGSSLYASYALSGLKVNFASGIADVTSGTASFTMQNYPQHSFVLPFTPPAPYVGTIQFLGSHMAKLTINPGQVFLVNLLTGKVTPA